MKPCDPRKADHQERRGEQNAGAKTADVCRKHAHWPVIGSKRRTRPLRALTS